MYHQLHTTCTIRKGTSGAGGTAESNNNGRGPYPISELLSLLAAFTFAQPGTRGLQRCLRAWSAFVAQATVGEGEGTAGMKDSTSTAQNKKINTMLTCCVTPGEGLAPAPAPHTTSRRTTFVPYDIYLKYLYMSHGIIHKMELRWAGSCSKHTHTHTFNYLCTYRYVSNEVCASKYFYYPTAGIW